MQSGQSGEIDAGLADLITVAVADLAGRLQTTADAIMVVSAQQVVWPDAALGCRHPDMRYKQVPVDGTLIELRLAGRVYRYHSGGSRPPFLCQN